MVGWMQLACWVRMCMGSKGVIGAGWQLCDLRRTHLYVCVHDQHIIRPCVPQPVHDAPATATNTHDLWANRQQLQG